jgi:NTE family protein
MKALVLAGGGAKGSFQVGVLQRFKPEDFQLVIGSSVGSLNGAGFSHIGPEALRNIWTGIRSRDDILSRNWWPFGSEGIYSQKPLEKLVRKACAGKASVPVHVATVRLESGVLTYGISGDADFERKVLASAAIPGVVNPVVIDGSHFVDGGVRDICPLRRAIDLGATEIVIVMCTPDYVPTWRPSKALFPFVNVMIRSLDILTDEILVNDIADCISKNGLPGKRHIKLTVYRPERELLGTLDFDPNLITAGINNGLAARPRTWG